MHGKLSRVTNQFSTTTNHNGSRATLVQTNRRRWHALVRSLEDSCQPKFVQLMVEQGAVVDARKSSANVASKRSPQKVLAVQNAGLLKFQRATSLAIQSSANAVSNHSPQKVLAVQNAR